MKPRLLPLRWTIEDFDLVWLGHLAKRKPFEWHGTHLSYIEADRRDADLMFALADCGPRINAKAWAHRMLDGSTNRTEAIWIRGFWVNLA